METCPLPRLGCLTPPWLLSPRGLPALDPLSQVCPSSAFFKVSGLKPLHCSVPTVPGFSLLTFPVHSLSSPYICSALASLLCPRLNSPSGSTAFGSQVSPGSGGSALDTVQSPVPLKHRQGSHEVHLAPQEEPKSDRPPVHLAGQESYPRQPQSPGRHTACTQTGRRDVGHQGRLLGVFSTGLLNKKG